MKTTPAQIRTPESTQSRVLENALRLKPRNTLEAFAHYACRMELRLRALGRMSLEELIDEPAKSEEPDGLEELLNS